MARQSSIQHNAVIQTWQTAASLISLSSFPSLSTLPSWFPPRVKSDFKQLDTWKNLSFQRATVDQNTQMRCCDKKKKNPSYLRLCLHCLLHDQAIPDRNAVSLHPTICALSLAHEKPGLLSKISLPKSLHDKPQRGRSENKSWGGTAWSRWNAALRSVNKRNPRGAEVRRDDDTNISNLTLHGTLKVLCRLCKARKKVTLRPFIELSSQTHNTSSNLPPCVRPDDPGRSAGETHPSQHPARGRVLTSISHVTDGIAILHATAPAAGQVISRLMAQMINQLFIYWTAIRQTLKLVHLARCHPNPPDEADVGGGAKTFPLIRLIYIRHTGQEIMMKQVDEQVTKTSACLFWSIASLCRLHDRKFQQKASHPEKTNRWVVLSVI